MVLAGRKYSTKHYNDSIVCFSIYMPFWSGFLLG